MTLDCDVAVVGAGPAGSRTARNLARAGLRVRLLEEHRRVGVPSHCSGLISPRTLKEAEIGDDAIIHRITGAFIHTSNGGEVALGGEQTRAVAMDRVRWDETLAEQAQRSGAELVRARLTNAERENGHVRLHTQTDGRDSTFTARVVVGADGAHSRVARSLGMAGPSERVFCLGIEGKLRTPRDDFVHVFVGSDLAPGWFGWIIPTGDGGVRAGIGSPKRRQADRLLPAHDRAVPAPLRRHRAVPLLWRHDPAGLRAADPTATTSSSPATPPVRSSRFPAAASTPASSPPATPLPLSCAPSTATTVSAEGLAPYERSWKREIGRELVRSLRVRHFGLALSDGEVERVVGALRSPGLQDLAARHGDIDYPSRVLLRLARSLPALGLLTWVTLRRPGAAWNLARAHLPFASVTGYADGSASLWHSLLTNL